MLRGNKPPSDGAVVFIDVGDQFFDEHRFNGYLPIVGILIKCRFSSVRKYHDHRRRLSC